MCITLIWIVLASISEACGSRPHVEPSVIRSVAVGVVQGDCAWGFFGYCLTVGPDENGDGVGEVLSATPYPSDGRTWAGRVAIIDTMQAAILREIGFHPQQDRSGAAACAIQLANDRMALAVGAPTAFVGERRLGQVEIRDLSSPADVISHIWDNGCGDGAQFGSTIVGGDDYDGDGVRDIVVGAPWDSAESGDDTGALVCVSPVSGAVIFRVNGQRTRDRFGSSIVIIPDLDGDGLSDIAVGAPGHSYVALISSHKMSITKQINGYEGGFGANLSLVRAGNAHRLIIGAPGATEGYNEPGYFAVYDLLVDRLDIVPGTAHDALGAASCSLGDLDQDGFDEFVVSATGWMGNRGMVGIYDGVSIERRGCIEGRASGEALGEQVAAVRMQSGAASSLCITSIGPEGVGFVSIYRLSVESNDGRR